MGFPKELVTIVSVESILIDIPSILEPFEKNWYPEGHDFEKSNKLFDPAYLGNKQENSWFRNSFSNSLEIRQYKKWIFVGTDNW